MRTSAYIHVLTMFSDLGQVYYCEADEDDQADGNWKLVNLDLRAISLLH